MTDKYQPPPTISSPHSDSAPPARSHRLVRFSLSGLNLNGVEAWVSDVFAGGALVIAVAISAIVGRRRRAAS